MVREPHQERIFTQQVLKRLAVSRKTALPRAMTFSRSLWSKKALPAFRRRQNPHCLAIFGNGWARNVDAVTGQTCRDMLVAVGFSRVFLGYNVANLSFYTLAGNVAVMR